MAGQCTRDWHVREERRCCTGDERAVHTVVWQGRAAHLRAAGAGQCSDHGGCQPGAVQRSRGLSARVWCRSCAVRGQCRPRWCMSAQELCVCSACSGRSHAGPCANSTAQGTAHSRPLLLSAERDRAHRNSPSQDSTGQHGALQCSDHGGCQPESGTAALHGAWVGSPRTYSTGCIYGAVRCTSQGLTARVWHCTVHVTWAGSPCVPCLAPCNAPRKGCQPEP